MPKRTKMVDGNEAAASVAYRTNEVIAIYPITPSSAMGELSDAWAAKGLPNLWGPQPARSLPMAAAVSSAAIVYRFAVEANQPPPVAPHA